MKYLFSIFLVLVFAFLLGHLSFYFYRLGFSYYPAELPYGVSSNPVYRFKVFLTSLFSRFSFSSFGTFTIHLVRTFIFFGDYFISFMHNRYWAIPRWQTAFFVILVSFSIPFYCIYICGYLFATFIYAYSNFRYNDPYSWMEQMAYQFIYWSTHISLSEDQYGFGYLFRFASCRRYPVIDTFLQGDHLSRYLRYLAASSLVLLPVQFVMVLRIRWQLEELLLFIPVASKGWYSVEVHRRVYDRLRVINFISFVFVSVHTYYFLSFFW